MSSEAIGETRQTYEAITQAYARATGAFFRPALLAELDGLPAGSLVADIGCGPGRDLAQLRERGMRAAGFDLSLGQLRTGGLDGVAQADMQALPIRSAALDAVWCHAALLHIPRELVPGVLGEFGRITRPGGELFLTVAEGDGEGWEVADRYESDRRRWFTSHRSDALTALLATAGFAVTREEHDPTGRGWLSLHARRAVDQ